MKEGKDLTIIGYGSQLRHVRMAVDKFEKENSGTSIEIVDLRTISPWDQDTVYQSVKKTGKAIVTHEAPISCGVGAEIVSGITEHCFEYLEAPILRICGYDTPFPLVYESFYLPDRNKLYEGIKKTLEF